MILIQLLIFLPPNMLLLTKHNGLLDLIHRDITEDLHNPLKVVGDVHTKISTGPTILRSTHCYVHES